MLRVRVRARVAPADVERVALVGKRIGRDSRADVFELVDCRLDSAGGLFALRAEAWEGIRERRTMRQVAHVALRQRP